MIGMLIEGGADPTIRDNSGALPSDLAEHNGSMLGGDVHRHPRPWRQTDDPCLNCRWRIEPAASPFPHPRCAIAGHRVVSSVEGAARSHRLRTGAGHVDQSHEFREGGGSRSPGRSGHSRARTAAAFTSAPVLALLIGLFAVPQAAFGQTADTLVSTVGQPPTTNTNPTDADHAQAFTTGTSTGGYKLTGVGILLSIASGTEDLPTHAVEIRENGPGDLPGDLVATMENPDTLTGGDVNSFNAPGTGIDLEPNTTYHVVWVVTETSGRRAVYIALTQSDSEDAGAATGWSLADGGNYRQGTGWTASAHARRISITGYDDTTAPTLVTGTTPRPAEAVTPTRIELRYNEPLDGDSVPAASAFDVTVGSNAAVNPSSVELSGSVVTLTLNSALSSSDTVTVTYTQPTGDAARIRDNAGNAAATYGSAASVHIEQAAPTLSTEAPPTVEGTEMTLTFNEPLDGTSRPAETAFEVTVGTAAAINPTSVAMSGSEVTLTLPSVVSGGSTVTVAYAVPGSNPLQDPFGNGVVAFSGQSVTVLDTTGPVLSTAPPPTVEGAALTLTYDEALDGASVPDASAFTVTVEGTEVALVSTGSVAVTGSTVVLTLAEAVLSADRTVMVSYRVPSPAATAIKDANGNLSAALTDEVVTVVDTTSPTLRSATVMGTALTLTWDERLDAGSTPPPSAFAVKVDGSAVGLASTDDPVTISGSTVVLTLAAAVSSGDRTVTVGYAVPTGNPIRDLASPANEAAALTDRAVTVIDAMGPDLISAALVGAALTLTWDEALTATPVPDASAFTVTVDGSAVGLADTDPVTISGSTVVLTLAAAVSSADRIVTVSYAVPSANPLRDTRANPNNAGPLVNVAVTVNDTTSPSLRSATVVRTVLTLTWDEVLVATPRPDEGDFSVTVGSAAAVNPLSVAISGMSVTLTLAAAVGPGEAVTVSYRKGTNPIRDRSGNDAADLSARSVTMVRSSDAALSGLVVEDGDGTELELSPAFTPEGTAYAVTVGTSVTLARVTATLNDAGYATLSGSLARAGGATEAVDMTGGVATLPELAFGATVLTMVVTAEDGTTERSYVLTVMREAAGTGPLKAWLARFGRTVAEHALDGVAGRMRASRAAGFRGEIGGLPSASVSSSGTGFDRYDRGDRDVREASVGKLLSGGSFSMTGEADGSGGSLAYWGRAAQTRFDGRDANLSVGGEVTTGMVGVDYARDRWTLGLTLMHSDGNGGWSGGESSDAGRIGATLTAVVPWSSWQATERLDFWGAVGKGGGKATLTPEGGEAVRSDIGWSMAAAGMRNALMSPADAGHATGTGPSLALNMDAMWVRTTSGTSVAGELAATASEVSRLRVGVEGEWWIGLENGGRLVPHMELAVRQDGGDAETGTGFELGGGLIWRDPELGLSVEVAGRTLLAHDAEGRKESGHAVAMVYDPAPATARGASFSLRRDWGDRANGGVDALFASGPMPSVGGSGSSSGRWEAEAAYGFPAFGGRFTSSPHVGIGRSEGTNDYSLGWRVTPEGSGAPDLSVGLETVRRERVGAAVRHGIGIGVSANW